MPSSKPKPRREKKGKAGGFGYGYYPVAIKIHRKKATKLDHVVPCS